MAITAQELLDSIQRDHFLNSMFSSYRRALAYAKEKNVLDYGCGYGWGSFYLAETGRLVTGFDNDRERIARAQNIFSRDNLVFTGDRECLRHQYDVICLFQVLQFLDADNHGLQQIYDCLLPGGVLLLSSKSYYKHHVTAALDYMQGHGMQILFDNLFPLTKETDLVEIGFRRPA
jgi:SAM-dependent methyltransferase